MFHPGKMPYSRMTAESWDDKGAFHTETPPLSTVTSAVLFFVNKKLPLSWSIEFSNLINNYAYEKAIVVSTFLLDR